MQVSNDLQNPMGIFSNFFQALFTPHLSQLPSSPSVYNSTTLQLPLTQPLIAEFLQ